MGWSAGAPQGIEIAPANEFHELRGLNLSAASIFSKNFVIPKIPVHGPGCLCTYNFLASQRQNVILAGNLLETLADQTICSLFQNTQFTIAEKEVKVRKHPDRTTVFR